MSKPVYLDHHATTPMDPRVLEAMSPYFLEDFGNASSVHHQWGKRARDGVEKAREQVASLISADPREIVFTGGATEANNLAISGCVAYHMQGSVPEGAILSDATEHSSVLNVLSQHNQLGWQVHLCSVNSDGKINRDEVVEGLSSDPLLMSVMLANNETGVIQDIEKLSELAKERGVFVHADGAQALGKIPVHVDRLGLDMLTMSAHKIYGPKGVGALYVRRKRPRVRLMPIFQGGDQEKGFNPGTLNVPGVVGFGEACEIAEGRMMRDLEHLKKIRDKFEQILLSAGGVKVNGSKENRLPGSLNICISGVPASLLMKKVPQIAFSSGSACSTLAPRASHVLRAMGLSPEDSLCSMRFGFGRFNQEVECDQAAKMILKAIEEIRSWPENKRKPVECSV